MAVALLMATLFSPVEADARSRELREKPTAAQQARAMEIERRVMEIHGMDLRALSGEERSTLKEELRAMKQEVRGTGGGVYISVGALIIILLLIIIL